MSTLQELLGDAYKDGMSLDEINAALNGKNIGVVDPRLKTEYEKVKQANNKLASEAADFRKKYESKLTDDERAKEEQQKKDEEQAAKIKDLERKVLISDSKTSYLAQGYSDDLASEAAEAFADNDFAKLMEVQKKALEEHDKKLKADFLKQTPKPPGGTGSAVMTKAEFNKLSYPDKLKYVKEHPDWEKELK